MITSTRSLVSCPVRLASTAILLFAGILPASAALKASYYSGRNFDAPVLERIDPRIEYRWEGQSPDPAVPSDEFSARWQGFVTPEFSGEYRLYVVSDNGSRLKLNGQVITDHFNPANGLETGWFSGTYTFTAGQKVPIEVDYYETTGNAEITVYWESADQLFQVIPETALTPPVVPPPVITGWTARYFDGRQFEKPVLARAETGIEVEWAGAPVPDLFADNFSVKWSGLLSPPETGAYTFTIAADNGTRLWIDGQLVSNAWDVVSGEDGGWRSVNVFLTAGRPVPILLDYYQGYGSASAALYWSTPSVPWEVVPGTAISGLPASTPPWIAAVSDTETPSGTTVELPVQATDASGAALRYSAEGLPLGVSLVTQTWPGLNPRDLPPVQTVTLMGQPWQPGVYRVSLSAASPAGTTTTRFTWTITGSAIDPGQAAALALVQSSLTITKNEAPSRLTLSCFLPYGITDFYRTELERSTDLISWENRTAEATFSPLPAGPVPGTVLLYEEALGGAMPGDRVFLRVRLSPTIVTRRAAPVIRQLSPAPRGE